MRRAAEFEGEFLRGDVRHVPFQRQNAVIESHGDGVMVQADAGFPLERRVDLLRYRFAGVHDQSPKSCLAGTSRGAMGQWFSV